ncbi:MAG: hypothetical protein RBR63_11975 [Methanosarcina vacuolata]|nr:hypothetical protein [Methanosarcina vacuolata]
MNHRYFHFCFYGLLVFLSPVPYGPLGKSCKVRGALGFSSSRFSRSCKSPSVLILQVADHISETFESCYIQKPL